MKWSGRIRLPADLDGNSNNESVEVLPSKV